MMNSRAAQVLMRKLEAQYATPERARALKGVQVLEQIGNEDARQLLSQLAQGAAGTKLTVAAKTALDKLNEQSKARTAARGGSRLPDPERVGKEPLTDQDRETVWQVLADGDATRAFQAMGVLRAVPDQAVAFLRERVRPTPPADVPRIPQLIAGLDSNRFADRDKAMKELEGMGKAAEPALRQALANGPSPEARRRLEQLLNKQQQAVLPPDTVRSIRVVEVLERVGTPQARKVLEGLAKGAAESALTQDARAALVRLTSRAAGARSE
jgi:hypothetical protein